MPKKPKPLRPTTLRFVRYLRYGGRKSAPKQLRTREIKLIRTDKHSEAQAFGGCISTKRHGGIVRDYHNFLTREDVGNILSGNPMNMRSFGKAFVRQFKYARTMRDLWLRPARKAAH